MVNNKMPLLFFLFMALFLQNGCVSLLPDPGPAPQKIFLNPSITYSPLPKGRSKSIAVSKPLTPTRYENNRLSVRHSIYHSVPHKEKKDQDLITVTDHVSGVVIQGNLPDLIQDHLIKALMTSEKFKAVGYAQESFHRDNIIESSLEAFDVIIEKNKIYAKIQMTVKLLSSKGRKIIWQKQFSETTPIAEHKISAFVLGLTSAYESVLYQITKEVH